MIRAWVLAAVVVLCGSSQAFAQTVERIAVIVVDFTDSLPGPTQTMDWIREDMARVDAFYAEQSYGHLTVESDVFGIYRVLLESGTATTQQIESAARTAAVADGVDLSAYDRIFFVSPGADLAGWGRVLGGNMFYQSPYYDRVSAPGFRLSAHEAGHAMHGWKHEHAYVCPDGPMAGACVVWEYGDSLSIMGHGTGHVSAILKTQEGWLTETGPYEIRTVTASGDYLISPMSDTSPGVKALKVIGGTRKWPQIFVVEYRQPIGFDACLGCPFVDQANVYGGAVIHWSLPLNDESYLLSMNPRVQPSIVDHPALMVGQTWCQGGRMSISVLSVSAAGAMVRVRMGHCR